MTDKLKKGDTLNVIGDSLYYINKVTEKAVLLMVRTDNEMKPVFRWVPKSVIDILKVDNLTSENGVVYRVNELPYFIRNNW